MNSGFVPVTLLLPIGITMQSVMRLAGNMIVLIMVLKQASAIAFNYAFPITDFPN